MACVKSSSSATTNRSAGIRRYAVLAGEGSFSTYLTHGFVMGPAARMLGIFSVEDFGSSFVLVMVPICTFLGIVIFQYFENPLLKEMNTRWGGRLE
jgi:peptidoglycan/LPS O-acetylase OafA/YrhL